MNNYEEIDPAGEIRSMRKKRLMLKIAGLVVVLLIILGVILILNLPGKQENNN